MVCGHGLDNLSLQKLMKITTLKQQVKNPQRVSIFVDGKYGFSLSIIQLADYKLKNGDELKESEVKKFKKISDDGKIAARALEWVLNRPHSIREFRDYMYRRKAEPELTDKLIEQFSDKGYLSDERFAKWLFELRARAGKSNRAIQAELFSKGVDREVVSEVLEAEQDSEAERLRVLINKKNLSRYKDDPVKLTKYLVSQGFNYGLVKKELE